MADTNYEKIISSIRHVVNSNGPLVVEYNKCVFAIDCVEISMKHIQKAAKQFENCVFEEIVQTTDTSFLLK